jgi:hypothetical protein
MNFQSLEQTVFHCIPVGPFEGHTSELIGSDIVAHLPVLEWFASKCNTVCEFGTRDAHSTIALLAGCGKRGPKSLVKSYDIEKSSTVNVLQNMTLPCLWEFEIADTGKEIESFKQCDLLFVDTLHIYDHVTKELAVHGRKATKYLAFHDVFTCGERDISGPNPMARGIMPAITEFMAKYPTEYRVAYHTNRNNGLLVLERIYQ